MNEPAKTLTVSYEIPHQNLTGLLAKLKQLSKKAEKLGLPAFEISQGSIFFRETPDGSMPAPYVPVSIKAQRPIIAGYRFLAKLEATPGTDENLIISMSSEQIPEKYRSCPPDCDHCKVKRNRLNTYLVQNIETDEIIQVGSSCLSDFTGHPDPHAIASYAQLLFEANDLMRGGGWDNAYGVELGAQDKASNVFEMKSVLAIASAVVRNEGRYESRAGNDHGFGTVDLVMHVVQKNRFEIVKPEDRAQAEAIIAWLTSDETADAAAQSDFLYNLRTLAHAGAVRWDRFGLAVAAVPAYQRHLREQMDKARGAQRYLGEIDKRIDLQVRFDFVHTKDGYWGTKRICNLTDMETGSKIVWFATGNVPMRTGSTYWITGTVANHGEYRGSKQTTLKRVVAPDLKLFDMISTTGDVDLKAFQRALRKVKDINVRNRRGETLLNCAVRSGKYELLPVLLAAGADPNIADDQGALPILPLICDARHDEVRVLVEHGALIDVPDEKNDRGVVIENPRDNIDETDMELLAILGESHSSLRLA